MDPYLSIILRTCSVYLFVIIAIRIFGKSQLSQLSVFDLVFILLISNSVQNAMVGPDATLQGGLIAAGSLFVLNYLIKKIAYRYKKVSNLLQGEPILLINKGRVISKNLAKINLSINELQAAIREHGVATFTDVNLAMLETDGNISILSNNYQDKSHVSLEKAKTLN